MKPTNWCSQRGIEWRLLLIIIGVVIMIASYEALAAGSFPNPPAGLTAPEQPTTVPDFQLPQVNGKDIGSADLRGKVVVMRFWSTW